NCKALKRALRPLLPLCELISCIARELKYSPKQIEADTIEFLKIRKIAERFVAASIRPLPAMVRHSEFDRRVQLFVARANWSDSDIIGYAARCWEQVVGGEIADPAGKLLRYLTPERLKPMTDDEIK